MLSGFIVYYFLLLFYIYALDSTPAPMPGGNDKQRKLKI